jgi:hypothetical protein
VAGVGAADLRRRGRSRRSGDARPLLSPFRQTTGGRVLSARDPSLPIAQTVRFHLGLLLVGSATPRAAAAAAVRALGPETLGKEAKRFLDHL